MPAINDRIAKLFRQYAILIQQDGEGNRFKIGSYNRAARTIEQMDEDVTEETVSTIAGVGKKLTCKIEEILETGDFHQRAELHAKHDDIMALLEIPNIGPKRAITYAAEIKKHGQEVTAKSFKKLVDDGSITVPSNIKAGLDSGLSANGRIPYATARSVADATIATLRPHTTRISTAGSLRRQQDTIGDVDILVCTDTPGRLINLFCSSGIILAKGKSKISKALGGVQIDLRIVDEDEWGAALLYFTGSKNFNIRMRRDALTKGWTLNEYALTEAASGKHIAGKTEEEIFEALEWDFVEPVDREEE
jgi:DNA polymerase (family 10)